MSVLQTAALSPLPCPLPPAPDAPLNQAQWTTLMALADAIVPSIQGSSAPDLGSTTVLSVERTDYARCIERLREPLYDAPSDLPERYLAENPSSIPQFRESLNAFFALHMNEQSRKGLGLLLSMLNTRAGSLLATGSATPVHLRPIRVREEILRRWARSYIPPLRALHKALLGLTKSTWLRTSPTVGPVLDYPSAPVHGEPGNGYDFKFIQFSAGSEPAILETDVVIVGSGCGAGVAAKNLAEDGHRIVVAERSYYHPPKYYPMNPREASAHLMINGGVIPSDDGSVNVVAGQTWGGGGTVNWSACLQTQAFVRREWADKGLPFFTSSEFQASLDRVSHRMGVSDACIEHNHNNRVLLEGSRRLGYARRVVPQNTAGKKHYCGYCTLGCGSAEKQGPAVSWLPDAAEAGAQFIEGLHIQQILFDDKNDFRTATGVRGTWTGRDGNEMFVGARIQREIIIKAKKVIVAGGTLQSPLLLMRSGLNNQNIGKNLHLHPAGFMYAGWDEDVKPWEGGILTAVCTEFENLDHKGYGVKLEATSMLPSGSNALLPWTSGLQYKMLAASHRRMTGHISLARDKYPGRVYPDHQSGATRISYTPSAFDRKHIIIGLCALARILYVAGARSLHPLIDGVEPFVRDRENTSHETEGVNETKFSTWLNQLEKRVMNTPDISYGSAHQMGTCRMGISPRESVVDPKGKVWDADGVYVMDASVFPSASGVNPMCTIMAISDWLSRQLGKEIRREREGGLEEPRL